MVDKWRLWSAWHRPRFPSELYYEVIASMKKEAAEKIEKKRLEDEFLAREDAKPPAQQIAELRAKLYYANRMVNVLRAHVPHIGPVPAFPYF